MKYIFTALFLFIVCAAQSQPADSSKTPYLIDKKLPFFKLILTDSSSFYTVDLKKKKNTLIIFFSPDCEHCKKLTGLILENTEGFKKTQIVMASSQPLSRIKEFYEEMKIGSYANIKMGKDALYFFGIYFRAQYLPFIALYNKKGELVKGWDGGTTVNELLEAVK